MAKDSGMTVKYKEDKKGDSYKITIELLKSKQRGKYGSNYFGC